MTEITDLPEETLFEDADWLIMYKSSAASNKTKKVSRNVALKGAALESVLVKLTAASGAVLTDIKHQAAVVAVPDVTTLSGTTVAVPFSGVSLNDQINLSFVLALPDGMHVQCWVSASDEVSIRFYNSTGSTITGTSYTAILTAMTFQ